MSIHLAGPAGGKKYGLTLAPAIRGGSGGGSAREVVAHRAAGVFAADDDDDDDGGHNAATAAPPQRSHRHAGIALAREQAAVSQAPSTAADAVADDSIYDYDAYLSNSAAAASSRGGSRGAVAASRGAQGGSSGALPPPPARESRYIGSLLSKAVERDAARDAVHERKLAREREKEEAEFGGKEKFVTGAYRAVLADRVAREAADAAAAAREAAADVTKQGDLAGFYRNLLTTNVAFGGHAGEAVATSASQRGVGPSHDSRGGAAGMAAAAAATTTLHAAAVAVATIGAVPSAGRRTDTVISGSTTHHRGTDGAARGGDGGSVPGATTASVSGVKRPRLTEEPAATQTSNISVAAPLTAAAAAATAAPAVSSSLTAEPIVRPVRATSASAPTAVAAAVPATPQPPPTARTTSFDAIAAAREAALDRARKRAEGGRGGGPA